MKITLDMNERCELHKNVHIICLLQIALLEYFQKLATEVVEKVEELGWAGRLVQIILRTIQRYKT